MAVFLIHVKLGLETPPHNVDRHRNELGRYEKAKHSSDKGQRVVILTLANVDGSWLCWALRWAPDLLELHDSQAQLSFSLWTSTLSPGKTNQFTLVFWMPKPQVQAILHCLHDRV